MKERPILFSSSMVRALLAGTKTQTRRIVKSEHADDADIWRYDAERGLWESGIGSDAPGRYGHGEWVRCPYGEAGDRLWVKETWQAVHFSTDHETGIVDDVRAAPKIPKGSHDGYWSAVTAADHPEVGDSAEDRGFPWRPSIFMPRWASRIDLEVLRVRVERLHDISEADARAEGCRRTRGACGQVVGMSFETARAEFQALWCDINGAESWAANPWLWVVDFKMVRP